jgi:hypothetical protein
MMVILAGGFKHGFYFPSYVGCHPSQLTNSYFSRCLKQSMDWFCWENLHRETMVFTMKLIGVSGSNFPIIQFHETTSKQMR